MPRSKPSFKRRGVASAALGVVAGALTLAGSASATSSMDTRLTLAEEELSDVSLATFFVFDKENVLPPSAQQARGCGRCAAGGRVGGCRMGMGGGCRCAGVGVGCRCGVGGCRCGVGGCRCGGCGGCGGGCEHCIGIGGIRIC